MTARRPVRARRLGRPPASDSGATRERIIHEARTTFAELGYAATTNKHVASNADVTTGAIYYYFDSKLALITAVYDEVQQTVYEHFDAAVDGATSFVGGLDAVLDVAHDLNNTDPSLARFLRSVAIDARRSPELRRVFKPGVVRRERFIEALVDLGVRTGELDVKNRARAVALIRAMLIGLVDAVSDDRVVHRAAVDGFKLLLEGKLVHV